MTNKIRSESISVLPQMPENTVTHARGSLSVRHLPEQQSAPSTDTLRLTNEWTIVHDFAFVSGGAEWVTQALANDVLPKSQVFHLSGESHIYEKWSGHRDNRLLPSFVNSRNYKLWTLLYPILLSARTPLPGNLLASSYAFSHYLPAEGAKVVYCHSPLRQAWSGRDQYKASSNRAERLGVRVAGGILRQLDSRVAQSANIYIATSKAVRDRILSYYQRVDVPIIPPPINDRLFNLTFREERSNFLWVGRITEPYKRLSLLIEAFRSNPGILLSVVGDGPDKARLQATAPENVKFLGWKSRQQLASLYRQHECLIFPGEDDFGLVPVEAMACGTPVIAYQAGGALDTLKESSGGLFFRDASIEGITSVISRFRQQIWDEREVAETAQKYSIANFRDAILQILSSCS